LNLRFFARPHPLGWSVDVADDRLAALGDVDVLDRHLLLALRAVFLQRGHLRGEGARELVERPPGAVLLRDVLDVRQPPGEGLLWGEVDFDDATWRVPGERMKRKLPHEVALSSDAVALLKRLDAARINQFVFPGRWNDGPLAHRAVWDLVQRLTDRQADQPAAASPHGFRASFRTWMAEQQVPFEVAEACLAHKLGNRTSQSYNHANLLKLRQPIMERWARFLRGEDASKVVPLRRA
jgi:hypothetical protein